ncbi:uncharacterized protein Fot_11015 [Forsythia ovata]|uniref:Uncharacterized protein n=1 Tax=Forsythia ovata TaxID=205694 RepID=A0ABD1WM71_9LAMI
MEARENGQKMNTSSFTFDHVDDNIELIDISAEDDGFLISSPLFDSLEDLRLSVTIDDRNEDDGYQFSEGENCQSTMEACRPSLAWDTAFFNSTGFLDPDELSFINKEFDTISARILPLIQDVHARRTDLESRLNGDEFSFD